MLPAQAFVGRGQGHPQVGHACFPCLLQIRAPALSVPATRRMHLVRIAANAHEKTSIRTRCAAQRGFGTKIKGTARLEKRKRPGPVPGRGKAVSLLDGPGSAVQRVNLFLLRPLFLFGFHDHPDETGAKGEEDNAEYDHSDSAGFVGRGSLADGVCATKLQKKEKSGNNAGHGSAP